VTYGLIKGQYLNFGFDIKNTVLFSNNKYVFNQLSVGPRIRWRPFDFGEYGLEIVIENGFGYRISSNNSSYSKIEINNQLLITKLFELYSYNSDLIFQAQIGFNVLPKKLRDGILITNMERNLIHTPATILIGLYPNAEWLFFMAGSYSSEWGSVPWIEDNSMYRRRSAILASGGIQYSFSRSFLIYISYSHLIKQERGGGTSGVNLGIRTFLDMQGLVPSFY
jgi:hypothetical protein